METTIYQRLPKIELHAHLHGSVRQNTIIELYKQKYHGEGLDSLYSLLSGKRTLKDCFHLFDVIHDLIETKASLIRITRELIEDFVNDGVIYAEIRTTPREYTVDGYLSEKDGIDVILNTIKEMEREYGDKIIIRLLLSINRSESKEKALRTAQLAIDYQKQHEVHIVGVDLSGNPTAVPFRYFQAAFDLLKKEKVPTVLHMGEVPNSLVLSSHCECKREDCPVFYDTDDILEYLPQRIGHALYLSEENRQYIINHQIPVEICPTSNRMTLGLTSMKDHPVLSELASHIPFSINTDDTVVFGITLSSEIQLVAELLNWKEEDLISFSTSLVNQILEKDSTIRNHLLLSIQSFTNHYCFCLL